MASLHLGKDRSPLRLGLAVGFPGCGFSTDYSAILSTSLTPRSPTRLFSNLFPPLCLPWLPKGRSGLELQLHFVCLSYLLYFIL